MILLPMAIPSNPHPAQALLLDHTRPKPEDRILILEGGNGWLAHEIAISLPDAMVSSHDRDIRNIEHAHEVLSPLPKAISETDALPTGDHWDWVLLTIPKERSYARLLLITAFLGLKVGGVLLLAGPSRTGAKAVIKDAKRLFGNGSVLDYHSHQRIARCIKQGELPTPLPKEFQVPGIAPETSHHLEADTPSGTIHLETCPGIFSWEKIDVGTAMLLENMEIEPGYAVWDVGCGYGILGLTAALMGADIVLMNDINTLAVNYAQKNADANHLNHKVLIFAAPGLNPPESKVHPEKFDLILSNPAFHQGRVVDKSMADQLITQAPLFLNRGGRLRLVANRFLNYDKTMQKIFKQVIKIEETNHFHVLEGQN